MPKDVLIRTFYNGVTSSTRDSIDAKVGGFLMRKIVDEAAQFWREWNMTIVFGLLSELYH